MYVKDLTTNAEGPVGEAQEQGDESAEEPRSHSPRPPSLERALGVAQGGRPGKALLLGPARVPRPPFQGRGVAGGAGRLQEAKGDESTNM